MKIPRSERICRNCLYSSERIPDYKFCHRTQELKETSDNYWCGEGMWVGYVNGYERHWDYDDPNSYEGAQTCFEGGNKLNEITKLLAEWYENRLNTVPLALVDKTRKFLEGDE